MDKTVNGLANLWTIHFTELQICRRVDDLRRDISRTRRTIRLQTVGNHRSVIATDGALVISGKKLTPTRYLRIINV